MWCFFFLYQSLSGPFVEFLICYSMLCSLIHEKSPLNSILLLKTRQLRTRNTIHLFGHDSWFTESHTTLSMSMKCDEPLSAIWGEDSLPHWTWTWEDRRFGAAASVILPCEAESKSNEVGHKTEKRWQKIDLWNIFNCCSRYTFLWISWLRELINSIWGWLWLQLNLRSLIGRGEKKVPSLIHTHKKCSGPNPQN